MKNLRLHAVDILEKFLNQKYVTEKNKFELLR